MKRAALELDQRPIAGRTAILPNGASVEARAPWHDQEETMNTERSKLVEERAYAIWQAAGCPDGNALSHWLQAERELDGAEDKPVKVPGKRARASRSAAANEAA
jgi:hypothetical protein